MWQVMLTISGAPLPILDIIHLSYLNNYILSIFHYLGSPLSYRTLIFDLMRFLCHNNGYVYTYIYSYMCTVHSRIIL